MPRRPLVNLTNRQQYLFITRCQSRVIFCGRRYYYCPHWLKEAPIDWRSAFVRNKAKQAPLIKFLALIMPARRIDLRAQVKAAGGMIVEVDHSRGNITSFNATQAQLQMGETHAPLSVVQMNGSPANAWAAQQVLDVAIGLNAKVFQSTHQNDLVSTFFARNPATGGLISSFMESHTNYGTNIDSDVARKIWGVGIFSSPSLPAFEGE